MRAALGTAATWGFVCWLAALPWTLGGFEFGFPPFLLALVAGGLCAFSFTNWVLSFSSRRIAWTLRMGMLLAITVTFVTLTAVLKLIKPLPDWASRQLFFLMIAFGPFSAWVLKMELYLFIDWLGVHAGAWLRRLRLLPKEQPDPVAPRWAINKARPAVLEVHALRWSMRALTASIVAVTLLGSGMSLAILISLDLHGRRVPLALAVIVCAVIGLALAYLFLTHLRSRRRRWKIMIDAAGISVACTHQSWVFPWGELTRVELRQNTDYARLVVASASQRISLLTGIVTRQPCHLPPFPKEVQRRLRSSGLVELPVKAADLAIWQRSS